jgi:hypothetical protein
MRLQALLLVKNGLSRTKVTLKINNFMDSALAKKIHSTPKSYTEPVEIRCLSKQPIICIVLRILVFTAVDIAVIKSNTHSKIARVLFIWLDLFSYIYSPDFCFIEFYSLYK